MLGVDCRTDRLKSLGKSLLAHSDVFGDEGRTGNLVGKRMYLCTVLPQKPVKINYRLYSKVCWQVPKP
jgi:hypothetical protein